MSIQLQLTALIGSIAFIVLIGMGFIGILVIPQLAAKPVYPMIIVIIASAIISPFLSWIIAAKIQTVK